MYISRWLEAEKADKAPRIILEATHQKALQYVSLDILSYTLHGLVPILIKYEFVND